MKSRKAQEAAPEWTTCRLPHPGRLGLEAPSRRRGGTARPDARNDLHSLILDSMILYRLYKNTYTYRHIYIYTNIHTSNVHVIGLHDSEIISSSSRFFDPSRLDEHQRRLVLLKSLIAHLTATSKDDFKGILKAERPIPPSARSRTCPPGPPCR